MERLHAMGHSVTARLLILTLALVNACGPSRDIVPALSLDVGPEAQVMPTVDMRYTSSDIDLGPGSPGAHLRLSKNGSVLMNGGDPSGMTMLVVDSIGREYYRFGPRGQGPGELQMAFPLGITDHGAMVMDMTQRRVVTFDTIGQDVMTLQLTSLRAMPFALLDDSTSLGMVFKDDPLQPRPAIIDLTSGRATPLLADGDSVIASFTRSLKTRGRQPTFGTWAGGFLVADGMEYRIALYDWDGKLVRILHRDVEPSKWSTAYAEAQFKSFRQAPPGRRLPAGALELKHQEMLESSHPHFDHLNPLPTDGAGRLWVVGVSGDSAYADVFSPEAHLGRIELPCPGFDRGWAVKGKWLALACAPTDPDYEGDAVLKLFRIN